MQEAGGTCCITSSSECAACAQALRMRAALALLTLRPRLLVGHMGSMMFRNLGWKASGTYSWPSVFTFSRRFAR